MTEAARTPGPAAGPALAAAAGWALSDRALIVEA